MKNCKKTNNGDKKFVTDRHPKTASSLLRPIKRIETVEKLIVLT